MNLFSSILRHFGYGSMSNSDTGFQYGSTRKISTDSGISVTDERALQVSAVWACTQYIANSICSLPIGVYRREADGSRQRDTAHYLNEVLLRSPNALMKPRDFRKAMTTQMVLWSNAYAEIFWNASRTRVVGLVPLRPSRMLPFITDDGVLQYHYQMEQGMRIYSKESILHLKGFGVDGVVGLERNNYARNVTGLSVSADVYASRQFAHGGRPGGGYLMFDTFLTDEQREQARTLYQGMAETAYEKGKIWILEGGVKYEADTVSPDTMQMIETRNMQVSEIARFYGVPDVLLGGGHNSKSSWPASFEQQLLSFLTFTLQDYMDEWECAINYSLLRSNDRERIFIDHDVTGFIKMDSQAKADLQSTWVQNGIKTRNEVRIMNNDQAIEGGDDLTVQVNLTPLQNLGANKEPEPVDESPDIADIEDQVQRGVQQITENMQLVNERMQSELALQNKKIESLSVPQEPPTKVVITQQPHKDAMTKSDMKALLQDVRNGLAGIKFEPVIKVDTPVINIQVPEQMPPVVNVEVPVPSVTVENTVELPKRKRNIEFTHSKDGKVRRASITEQ